MNPAWSAAPPLVLAATLVLPVPQQRAAEEDVRDWLRLVHDHRPGAADHSVLEASRWKWSTLNPVLQELHQDAQPAVVLRSAAMLSDIAFHVPVEERPSANISGYSIIAQDGQTRRMGMLDAHLAAARRLVDALPRHPSADAAEVRSHVIAWYRTVSAALASTHNLADLEPHVKKALARFPDDAGILFDAGGFFEAFASPMTQIPLAEHADRSSHQVPGKVLLQYKPSPGALLNEAQRHFRRAVELAPAFAEARVRLGRVLVARERATDAIPELQRAVTLDADVTVKYYAWMFLGAALADTGRAAEAIRAYRSASALFPQAQSPQLAISQIAGEQGNITEAREALDRALAPGNAAMDRFDPWWVYLRGEGRNIDSVHELFAARIQALPEVEPDRWRGR
jgi:tetratricopeptide (TPR) repeat protein